MKRVTAILICTLCTMFASAQTQNGNFSRVSVRDSIWLNGVWVKKVDGNKSMSDSSQVTIPTQAAVKGYVDSSLKERSGLQKTTEYGDSTNKRVILASTVQGFQGDGGALKISRTLTDNALNARGIVDFTNVNFNRQYVSFDAGYSINVTANRGLTLQSVPTINIPSGNLLNYTSIYHNPRFTDGNVNAVYGMQVVDGVGPGTVDTTIAFKVDPLNRSIVNYGLWVDSSKAKNYLGGYTGIFNKTPLAPLHVGNRNVNNSVDAVILLSRLVDNSVSGNGHAFSDASLVTRSGNIGYASYDARINVQGTTNYDHYAAFQFAPVYNYTGNMTNSYGYFGGQRLESGSITNSYGLYSTFTQTAGSVSNFAHFYAHRGTLSGGSINNMYGIRIDSMTNGSNRWGLYMETSRQQRAIEIRHVGTGDEVNQLYLNRSSGLIGDAQVIRWGVGGFAYAAAVGMELAAANSADLVFKTTTSSANATEKMRIKGNGYVGLNTVLPTSQLDVVGANGYNQLRLRTSYTPTSTADANGSTGDVSWDDSFIYIKTSGGWKRSALTTF